MSVDEFSNFNLKSLLKIMAGGPFDLFIKKLRLEGK